MASFTFEELDLFVYIKSRDEVYKTEENNPSDDG